MTNPDEVFAQHQVALQVLADFEAERDAFLQNKAPREWMAHLKSELARRTQELEIDSLDFSEERDAIAEVEQLELLIRLLRVAEATGHYDDIKRGLFDL